MRRPVSVQAGEPAVLRLEPERRRAISRIPARGNKVIPTVVALLVIALWGVYQPPPLIPLCQRT